MSAGAGRVIVRAACALRRIAWPHGLTLGAAVVVILVYYPVVQADYGKLDDYWFLWASNTDPDLITEHDWVRGRFLAAFLHRWAFGAISTISEIRWVRGLTVLGLAGFAAAFTALLRARGWPPLMSAALAVFVCTTPSAQSTVGFATSVHRPFAALCALVASGAAVKAARGRSISRGAVWLLVAIGALVGALFFQQSWAMFYVPCCFVLLFRPDSERPEPGRLRLLAAQGATLLLALAAAVAALRSVAEPTVRSSLTQDGFDKLGWFVTEVLVNAGSLFQFPPSYVTVPLLGALIVMGGVAFVLKGNTFAAISLLGGLGLLPFAYLPNLLSAESWASYRSIGPLSAMVLVLAVWALLGIARAGLRSPHVAVTALVVGVAGWSCVEARATVLIQIVEQQVAERELFRAQLLQGAGRDLTAVHVIQPAWEHWPTDDYRYDDFGVPSSFADWCPEPMFRLIVGELPRPLAEQLAGLPVTWGFESKAGDDSKLLQIDMRSLREFYAARRNRHGKGGRNPLVQRPRKAAAPRERS